MPDKALFFYEFAAKCVHLCPQGEECTSSSSEDSKMFNMSKIFNMSKRQLF